MRLNSSVVDWKEADLNMRLQLIVGWDGVLLNERKNL